jgi:signal transduction histidine kinase
METRRSSTSTARQLVILLAAVAVLPSIVLVWFGIRLLDQDRELVSQRDFERRQAAAPVIVASVERALVDAERQLIAGQTPSGTVRLTLTPNSASVEPREKAAWLPVAAAMPEAEDRSFDKSEVVESRNLTAAFSDYQASAKAGDPAIRAGALLRLGRVARRLDRLDDALRAYRAMARIDRVMVLGAPADLQGRRWSIEILKLMGRTGEAVNEANALEKDLLSGRWSLDGGTWGMTAANVTEVTGRAVQVPDAVRLVSELADTLARELEPRLVSLPEEKIPGPVSSRRLIESGQARALAIIVGTPGRTSVLVVDPVTVNGWMRMALEAAPKTGASIRLLSQSGRAWAGVTPTGAGALVTAAQADTGLPWTVAVDAGDISDLESEFSGRRTFFVSGVALVVALLAVATFLVWRAVRREMAVARLQTDFVATVSHEFRTPLTSMRHVTDLLEENDDLEPGRRGQFYRTLGRNTERLHRLVEALLDFSRMESGRKPYDLQPTDVSELASRVVEEFRHEPVADRAAVTFRNGGRATALADASSLSTALWNLLDNAVKYSDGPACIDIAVDERPDGRIALSVADKGIGIPAQEREAILGRFVRGADAGRLGIKGTGLGLALVSHIVAAHHGRLEIESTVGEGSMFTIVLPADVRSAEFEVRNMEAGSSDRAGS